jgi:hypothetical protein
VPTASSTASAARRARASSSSWGASRSPEEAPRAPYASATRRTQMGARAR